MLEAPFVDFELTALEAEEFRDLFKLIFFYFIATCLGSAWLGLKSWEIKIFDNFIVQKLDFKIGTSAQKIDFFCEQHIYI